MLKSEFFNFALITMQDKKTIDFIETNLLHKKSLELSKKHISFVFYIHRYFPRKFQSFNAQRLKTVKNAASSLNFNSYITLMLMAWFNCWTKLKKLPKALQVISVFSFFNVKRYQTQLAIHEKIKAIKLDDR